MRGGRAVLVAAVVLLLTGGCGRAVEPAEPAAPAEAADLELAEVTGGGSVLENAQHGPELCSTVAASYPPQCGGIELAGWDWAWVPEAERVRDVAWISGVRVTGTWDTATAVLTITRPPRVLPPHDPMTPLAPPPPILCPEPAGGWRTDPAAHGAVGAYVNAQPDLSAWWVGWDEPPDPRGQRPPGRSVLHARFTGDVERHRAALAALDVGDVCVLEGGVARSRLEAIVSELVPAMSGENGPGDLVEVGTDELAGQVRAVTAYDDGTLQQAYDERFGAGMVQATSLLRPVEQ